MSPESAGSLSLRQALFFVNDYSAIGGTRSRDPQEMKRDLTERYNSDPDFRDWYRAKIDEELRKSRESIKRPTVAPPVG